jgi:hypothetical protein
MSRHQEWKMVHLLYQYAHRSGRSARPVLTEDELRNAGVHCDVDTWQILKDASGIMEQPPPAPDPLLDENACFQRTGAFFMAESHVVAALITKRAEWPG